MIYKHFSMAPWDYFRWPNFYPSELFLHCRCCGEFYYDPESMDMLQAARTLVGRPFKINSGHRCVNHNSKVGGALKSEHLRLAFDISIDNHDRQILVAALQEAGFSTFGFYKDFIHTDKRPNRRWYGKGARDVWKNILI